MWRYTLLLILLTAVVEDIFKIGSMAPGAILFEAYKEFKVHNTSRCTVHNVTSVSWLCLFDVQRLENMSI